MFNKIIQIRLAQWIHLHPFDSARFHVEYAAPNNTIEFGSLGDENDTIFHLIIYSKSCVVAAGG